MILIQITNNSLYRNIQLDFQNTEHGSKELDYTGSRQEPRMAFGNMTMSVSVPKNIKYFGHYSKCRLFKKLNHGAGWVIPNIRDLCATKVPQGQ